MVLVYDGTYEGFLSAVFEAYALHIAGSAMISTEPPLDQWREVRSDRTRADRVTRKLAELRMAEPVFDAWLSREQGIENDLLAVIAMGLKDGYSPMRFLCEESVKRVSAAAHKVSCEAYHFLQFTRFVRAESVHEPTLKAAGTVAPGLYVADIEPQYDILPRLGGHFAKRFQDQFFVIRDLRRSEALVYDTERWQLVNSPELMALPLPEDSEFEHLWRRYFDSVAIPWRRNKKLQQQFVPQKYRTHMTEFQPRRA